MGGPQFEKAEKDAKEWVVLARNYLDLKSKNEIEAEFPIRIRKKNYYWNPKTMTFNCQVMKNGQTLRKIFHTGKNNSGPRFEKAEKDAKEWVVNAWDFLVLKKTKNEFE